MEIKDILYQAISNYQEHKILSDIVQGESDSTINAIFDYCVPSLDKMSNDKSQIRGSFAEGLIHYLLTVAMIPSQRKTSLQSIDIDVTVPDTKTLASSPKDAVVIVFPKTDEFSIIKEQIKKIKKIQPHSENIWVVLEDRVPLDAKVYTLDKQQFTFANIINDLINFSSNAKQSKLKIFRI